MLTNVEERSNTWLFLKNLRESIGFMENNMIHRDYSYALRKERDIYNREKVKVLVDRSL